MIDDRDPDRAVLKEVLAYFVRHPEAVDDLEGIARWRLMEEAIRAKVEETHRALEWLVEHGFLERHAAGTTPLFSLDPANAGRASEFLAADDPCATVPRA